jgi:hypothetical protein
MDGWMDRGPRVLLDPAPLRLTFLTSNLTTHFYLKIYIKYHFFYFSLVSH